MAGIEEARTDSQWSDFESDAIVDALNRGLTAGAHASALAELERRGIRYPPSPIELAEKSNRPRANRFWLAIGFCCLAIAFAGFLEPVRSRWSAPFGIFSLILVMMLFLAIGTSLIRGAYHDKSVTDLMKAAALGEIATMATALAERNDINSVDDQGATALFYSLMNRQSEAALWLIAQGADTSVCTRRGTSALALADKNGMSDVAAALRQSMSALMEAR